MPGELPAPFAAAQHDVVGDHIELLLGLALHVAASAFEPWAPCSGRGRCSRDVLDRGLDIVDQRGELFVLATRSGVADRENLESVVRP